jgi:hypothetical protein
VRKAAGMTLSWRARQPDGGPLGCSPLTAPALSAPAAAQTAPPQLTEGIDQTNMEKDSEPDPPLAVASGPWIGLP